MDSHRGYFRIDPKIRALVAVMNARGFRTYASCQGHGCPVIRLPYVAFTSPEANAADLERRLRNDAESASPQLCWGWSVKASFNSDFHLCFRLQPEGPHRWYYRYCLNVLHSDFSEIIRLLRDSPERQGR